MADLNQVVAFITGQAAFIPLHPLTAQNIFRKIRIGKGLAAEARNVKPSLLDAAGAYIGPKLLQPGQAGAHKDTARRLSLDVPGGLQQIMHARIGGDRLVVVLRHQARSIRPVPGHHC